MELIDFLRQTQNEIRKEYQTAQPGVESPFPELIFTEIIMRHMADIGMTFDDAETCHFMAKVSDTMCVSAAMPSLKMAIN